MAPEPMKRPVPMLLNVNNVFYEIAMKPVSGEDLRATKGEELDVSTLQAALQLGMLALGSLGHIENVDIESARITAGRSLRHAGVGVVGIRLLHHSLERGCRVAA